MSSEKRKVKTVMCFLFAICCFLEGFATCSSAPKQTGDVLADRDTAYNQLNLANRAANRGHYRDALLLLEEARRLAVSADDPSLRVATSTSRGNFLFYLGRHDEAFSEWEAASAEGDSSGEPVLAALARIYSARAKIMVFANEGGGSDAAIEELKAQAGRDMAVARSDAYSTAAGNITLGLAERQLRRWDEAEREIRRALDFHERNKNLEDAAYCWFIIASIRSMAGDYEASLQALRTAISFDRRVENGFGLASSWQAMGDVYEKAGRMEEARSARRRAAEIYRAIDLDDLAENLD